VPNCYCKTAASHLQTVFGAACYCWNQTQFWLLVKKMSQKIQRTLIPSRRIGLCRFNNGTHGRSDASNTSLGLTCSYSLQLCMYRINACQMRWLFDDKHRKCTLHRYVCMVLLSYIRTGHASQVAAANSKSWFRQYTVWVKNNFFL